MVLSRRFQPYSASSACKGPVDGALLCDIRNSLVVRNIFFKLCKACQARTMASIPPSAFSAARIRQTQRGGGDMKLSKTVNVKDNQGSTKFFNTTLMEPSPLKYNSKLMNSIWGFYNRYSPHNVKKINDAIDFKGELQQTAANSGNKGESKLSLPSPTFDNVWAAINVSQSH